MRLIDKYLSKHDFTEVHRIEINVSASKYYLITFEVDLAKSKIITVLFKLRGMPISKTRFKDFVAFLSNHKCI